MAAAATEMGLLPGTRSSSTAFLAMKVAAICTCLGRPRLEQKRDMKSPVVMRSTLVSRAFRISLKHLPISFFEIRETAQISVKGGGKGVLQTDFVKIVCFYSGPIFSFDMKKQQSHTLFWDLIAY